MMEKYPIHITAELTEEKLQKGVFIFIFRASKIPPHIGVITNGMLYDITSVGPNRDLPVADFYNTILKRKTEVLFVELPKPSDVDTKSIINQKVTDYWKVTNDTSCLNPVKDFINEVYNIDVSEDNFVFELLPSLLGMNLVKGVSQLNLTNKIVNGVFELTKYTEQDIENCIAALSRKEKTTC